MENTKKVVTITMLVPRPVTSASATWRNNHLSRPGGAAGKPPLPPDCTAGTDICSASCKTAKLVVTGTGTWVITTPVTGLLIIKNRGARISNGLCTFLSLTLLAFLCWQTSIVRARNTERIVGLLMPKIKRMAPYDTYWNILYDTSESYDIIGVDT